MVSWKKELQLLDLKLMTGLRLDAASTASHFMNSPSSIITNHLYECSMSMSLKTSYDVSNGTALAK